MWIIPLTCTIWFNSALVDEAVHVWIYDGRTELQAQFLNFLKLFFIWRGTCGGISVGFHSLSLSTMSADTVSSPFHWYWLDSEPQGSVCL